MKKCIVLIVICAIVIVIVFICNFHKKSQSPEIGSFDFDDYQDFVAAFPSGEIVENPSNLNKLVADTEKIWVKIYGENIKRQKPYQVFHDKENGVWLVQGTLQPNTMGGVANILVENDTGKVLAIWHDK